MKNNEKLLKQKIKNDKVKKNQKQNLKNNKNVNIEQKLYIKCNFMPNIILQKSLVKRKGDWICKYCNNLNFGFRKECNRCKMVKSHYNNNFIKKLNKYNN
jgi:hypothetical protein